MLVPGRGKKKKEEGRGMRVYEAAPSKRSRNGEEALLQRDGEMERELPIELGRMTRKPRSEERRVKSKKKTAQGQ